MTSTRKRHTRFALIIPFLLIGCILGLFFSPVLLIRVIGLPDYIRNNQDLKRFSENLYSYPLPPGAQIQSLTSSVTLMGNSNHCDFIAELTILTEMSLSELEAYYKDVTFPPVRSEPQGYEDSLASGVHGEIRPHIEPENQSAPGDTKVFKIRLVDFGYPPGWDYRCH